MMMLTGLEFRQTVIGENTPSELPSVFPCRLVLDTRDELVERFVGIPRRPAPP